MPDQIRIGITGATGFIGRNLQQEAATRPELLTIACPREAFEHPAQLQRFVASCDAVVHLAAVSRHADGTHLYNVNMNLVRNLIAAMTATAATPHVLFASTTHEARDTPYHASKRDGRRLLDAWAEENGGRHTTLLLPNAFGPYGKPFYNSVTATFCRQLADGETPQILTDAPVRLIYIRELCRAIIGVIVGAIATTGNVYSPSHRYEVKVSELLARLQKLAAGGKPDTEVPLEKDLAATLAFYRHH
ncbi:MAG: NAD-dependent epimerase/dehydratase family protein [Victivallales bacterium]|nr:NAD-dependent epimerase/dehydratase family protein [Victivallales bacterium]